MVDSPSNSSRKRRVKNPESFRQRATKASIEKTPNKALTSVKSYISKAASPITDAIKTFFGNQAFRFLRKPLRIVGKILLPVYFRNSWRELKLVTWPSLKQSRQLTFAVLTFAVVFGAAIAGVDWGLDKVFRNILLK